MTRSTTKAPAPAVKKTARKTAKAVAAPETTQPAAVPAVDRIPDVPNIYADAVLDVVFGVYTSKVLLGFETGGGAKPISVVTLPTEALVTACMKILENLSNPTVSRQITARHENFAQTLQSLGVDVESLDAAQKH